MDPIQRHTWLREHQLPNQKPSKLMVTETQNLTRNQILTLQNFERPRLFHAQLPKDQTNLQQAATDIQSPPHTLTTTPQTPQPLLSFLEKRNYQDEQNDPNETKKQKSDNTPDESAINNDPPPQPPTPFINSTTIIDPSQTENNHHEQPQTNKRKHLNQQHHTNEDIHEPKKQRLPNDLETQTRSELPTTYPFFPINTIVTEDVYIPTDPLLEILTIPTFSQPQTQPQTIESTSNETTFDSPNQEHVATESYGFKPHSGPTTEILPLKLTPPSPQFTTPLAHSPTPLDQAQSTPNAKPDDLHEQFPIRVASTNSLMSSPTSPHFPSSVPDNWSQMSRNAKKRWSQHHKP
jgi:hypothetical protein